MALQAVACHDGVGNECVGGHDTAEQQRCHGAIMQDLYGHEIHENEWNKEGHKTEDAHLVQVLPQVLHVSLQACKEHDIKQSHLAEELEARITLQDIQPIRSDKHAGKHHTDDVGNTQLAHHNWCKENDDKHGEEHHRGISYRKAGKHPKLQNFLQNCKKKLICANN